MRRFTMANSLVARAQAHQQWIGNDHGDRYEEALIAEEIPSEMQVVVKEMLEHLRSALDYCAQQVWLMLSGRPIGARIYFPIARKGIGPSEFISIMNRNLPGVASASQPALRLFESFQFFADAKNEWLPELATLANQTKHNHLEAAAIPNVVVKMAETRDRVSTLSTTEHEQGRGGTSWMKLRPISGDFKNGTFQAAYLQLAAIDMELNYFISEAIPGVQSIIEQCRRLVSQR